MSSSPESLIHSLLALLTPSISLDAVESITQITPDASARRYYRISLKPPYPQNKKSIVAMIFDSVACPEVGGNVVIASDESYVELTHFLASSKIPVPELLLDARDKHCLLLEDVGEMPLGTLLKSDPENPAIVSLYKQAIEFILKLQQIPTQKDFFPFKRAFTREVYLKEMSEFTDYLLPRYTTDKSTIELTHTLFHTVADALSVAPKVLTHRDYHSWNLHVESGSKIRIIDFQDSLLGTAAYDLASLLNDRDTDSLLGDSRYKELYNYFAAKSGVSEEFHTLYLTTLLQRDLKVAGRFAKLTYSLNRPEYAQWIPGTLKRIGKSLAALGANSKYSAVLNALSAAITEISHGAQSNTPVFLLAAGFGKRLKPLTEKTPKPLIKVQDKALVDWNLELIAKSGFKQVIINTHYLHKQIETHIEEGNRWGLNITCVYEPVLLETGGAIKNIEPLLRESGAQAFITINSDILLAPTFNLQSILTYHQNHPVKPFATLLLRKDKDAKTFGSIGINPEGRICTFLGSHYYDSNQITEFMFTGVQALSTEILSHMPESGSIFSITQNTHVELLQKGLPLCGLEYTGYWNDIGTPERLEQARLEICPPKS